MKKIVITFWFYVKNCIFEHTTNKIMIFITGHSRFSMHI